MGWVEVDLRSTTVPSVQAPPEEADPSAHSPAGRPPTADPSLGPVAAPTGSWLARHRYAVLAAVVVVVTGSQTINGQWSTDMWEHVAVVRELIARPFDPSHPQILSDATHPGFSPYTVALGLVGHVVNADAITVLSWAGIVNVVLLLLALRLLVIEVTSNARAPFWALLFVLALWGVGPYRYSGFFGLNSIGFVAPYPSTFATAVGFGVLVAAIRYVRGGRRRLLVPVAVGTAVVVLVHPLSAPWLVMALLAVAVSGLRDLHRLPWLALAAISAIGLCLLWPYYPIVGLVSDSTNLEALNQSMYSNVIVRVAPALLGLVVIVRRWRADRRDLLGLLLAGSLAIYLIGAATGDSSYGRSLAFIVVVLDMALADGVARIEAVATRDRGSRPPRWRAGGVALGGLVVVGLVMARGGLIRMVPVALLPASVRDSDELIRPDEQYDFLLRSVGPLEVVIGSQPQDNRVIPALTGRTLALAVPRPFVDDADERKLAEREFLDPTTPAARREEIQARYHVRFVVLHRDDGDDRTLLDVLEAAGASVLHRDGELVLVELPPPS